MSFWIVVLGSVFLAAAACVTYLVTRVLKFRTIHSVYEGSAVKGIGTALLVLLVPALIILLTMGALNAMICVIHLAIFWALCDLAGLIFKNAGSGGGNVYWQGICAIALTVVYLSVAFIMAYSIAPKEYDLKTDKAVGDIRIIQFADAHIGTTFGAEGFSKAVEKMRQCNPDIVVITGDFVDNSTPEEDFTECCRILGSLNPKYGIYYVFGNHDRSFSSSMLNEKGEKRVIDELEKNGIRVLQDEAVLIDDRIYVIGRQDFSMAGRSSGRQSMQQLVNELDSSKYLVVLDHQPRDYEAQEAAGVDLVLSGHTHGGQMIPLAPLVAKLGDNDRVYGHEKRGGTDFVVTSGISDWEIKFKSGCRSEFVVIDVEGQQSIN